MMGRFALGFVVLCVCLAGCGSDKTAPVPTASEQASEVKAAVDDFVANAKQDSKEAASNLEMLIELLEARASEAPGKYDAVVAAAKELKTKYEQKAEAEIDAQLTKLSEAASAL